MKYFAICTAALVAGSVSQTYASSETAVFIGKSASKLEVSGVIDQYATQHLDGQAMLNLGSGGKTVHVDFMNSGPGRWSVDVSVDGFPLSQWGETEQNVSHPFPLHVVEQSGVLKSEMFPALDSVFVHHDHMPDVWSGKLDFSQVSVNVSEPANLVVSSDGVAQSAISSVTYSNGEFKVRSEDGREKVLPFKTDVSDRNARVVAALMDVLQGQVVSTMHEGNSGGNQVFTVKTEPAAV